MALNRRKGESLGDWLVLLAILVAVWATVSWGQKYPEYILSWTTIYNNMMYYTWEKYTLDLWTEGLV